MEEQGDRTKPRDYGRPLEPILTQLSFGHARPSIAATSPADWEWRRAVLAGRGGGRRGRASTPEGVVPRGIPMTNS